jgi:hypothetical protein
MLRLSRVNSVPATSLLLGAGTPLRRPFRPITAPSSRRAAASCKASLISRSSSARIRAMVGGTPIRAMTALFRAALSFSRSEPTRSARSHSMHVGDELAALATLQGGGDAHLDAELVGLVRFALADALDLGSVQAVDLGAALAAFLIAHPPCQAQPAVGPARGRAPPRTSRRICPTASTPAARQGAACRAAGRPHRRRCCR